MSRAKEKFRAELDAMGLGSSVLVPVAARALFAGARYALGLLDEREYRDTTTFETRTSDIGESAFAAGASGSIRRMAEFVLMANGKDRSQEPVVQRAFAVEDFGALMTAIGSALIRDAYGQVPLAHRTFARRAPSAKNYKPTRVGVVSSGSPLPRVMEMEPIPHRHAGQHAAFGIETTDYAVDQFSEVVDLSRQMLINDEIGFIAEFVRQSGIRAAETERKVIWDLIMANPSNFWHVSRGNSSSAASGATVSSTTLALARSSLRSQVAPDGSLVASRLAYVVAGPATEDVWEALLAARWMPGSDDPAALKPPTVLIEPRITDQSWYGFADYRLGAGAVEYAYLDGADRGLRVEQHRDFEREGLSIKTSLDFNACLVDYRGTFRMQQSS